MTGPASETRRGILAQHSSAVSRNLFCVLSFVLDLLTHRVIAWVAGRQEGLFMGGKL